MKGLQQGTTFEEDAQTGLALLKKYGSRPAVQLENDEP